MAKTDPVVDKASGRAKEAAGALTGDKSLKMKGRAQHAKGSLKETGEKLRDAAGPRRPRKKA